MHKSIQIYSGLLAICISIASPSGAQVAAQSTANNGASVVRDALDRLNKKGLCKELAPELAQSTEGVLANTFEINVGVAAANCAIRVNQPDLALDILRILNRDFPSDPKVLYLSVHAYSDLSTLAAQQLIAVAPKSPELLQLEAESLEMEGKVEASEKIYRTLLEQNPRLAGIHYRIGKLLLLHPNPSPTVVEQAKQEFQVELEIDSSNAGAEYFLGDLARQESHWPEAIDHLSRAIHLDTTLADAYLGLGGCLVATKRFADAIEPLQTAVKLRPLDPVGHYNLAVAYGRTGRKDDAEREFTVHRQLTESRAGASNGTSGGTDDSKTLLH
jgi:tetratricopeptide (TPR) repeat protein